MNKRTIPKEHGNKLIYNSNLLDRLNGILNIALIDSTVSDNKTFYDSTNSETFPIIYNGLCLRSELQTLLSNFTSIERICIIFDEKRIPVGKLFINYSPFFKVEDLTKDNFLELSDNFRFLINLLGNLRVKFLDFLACNSLKYDNFVNFYKKSKILI